MIKIIKIKALLLICLIYFFSKYALLSKELLLPVVKNQNCEFYLPSGERLFRVPCEDVGKQSYHPIPVKHQGKWGYVDSKGDWWIAPEFDFADNFYGNYARVRKENHFGMIDLNKKQVIPTKYRYLGNFDPDTELLPFQCESSQQPEFGYMNIKEQVLISCQFQQASEFRNQIAKIRKWDLYGFLYYDKQRQTHRIQYDFKFRLAGELGNQLVYVLHKHSFFYFKPMTHEFIKIDDTYIPGNFSITDPLAKFQDTQTGWYGYWNTKLEIQIPAIFLEADDFWFGFAKVKGSKNYRNFINFIDKNSLYSDYQKQQYEEFYINTKGERITF
ncbi:MAG: WG repeat-containing protein [Leptospiraceae bacterium]|nr:WG repeat-containing protein [Leptospiraceae bacterium]MDW7977141.1 WG repeat-containing protein [Leptospiraceae bacterium]